MIKYDRISYLFNPNKHNLLINGIYWGYNPLILTFDPNFQRDIQSRDKDGCTPNVRVPMVFSWCSLGILGDYNPYIPTL